MPLADATGGRIGEGFVRVSTATDQQRFAGPLSAAVADLCQRLRPQVCDRTAAGFREVLRRLSAPLQVAVAGRIKSGKSTLVNALIGRRVAPTDVGECTRLVTRFQYGTVDRVEVVFTDGRKQVLPFDAHGMIPAELGVAVDEVSHLEAYLTNAVLRDLTVIDTPGLGSLDAASVARTEQLLGAARAEAGNGGGDDELDPVSRNAVAGAEAVIYVVTQAVRSDDHQALAAFTAATASREAGPVNAIAVLNKADTIAPESVEGADGDVWRAATLLAEKQASTLKPRVADVLPVIGLLAETAETGGFTSADADALRQLAELDEATREMMLISADLFATWECAVPAGTRARLLERLDLYGVRRALEILDAEPAITAGALRRRLLDASGLDGVRGRLDAVFRARADGIKAAAALASVTALAHASGDPGERQRVHDAIEVLLAKPEAHQLRLLEALTLVAAGAVVMPEDLAEEVLRVGSSADPGEQLGLPGRPPHEWEAYALERAGWWRSFAAFGATPAQSRIAHVVHRAYFLIWQQLRGRGAT
ncbi:Dynamin family protein [Streptoalloteichus tenebrarius]|uniref:Dynamin family protein n=1 Tax=Streptoalloteichus tenebrarius (strain ATCC 17920 / DSM 40477 / JCM 4838 / CBS 697.72 / NBRC 16177 / NCIMB 11028 / NRRL B-12390 / A12253. 1 / ISP 5477) TaxID=1933 RepID=A0ABT1I2H7_STRSD|nr:Dynamin family protein [Streptoalloteichus tenebrarius]BFF02069.1 dynamin family protein [Streptoalloteichus tenebrarius]